jgi:hypothetical protein
MKPVEGMELSASLGFSKPFLNFRALPIIHIVALCYICLAAKGVVCGVVLCGF